MEDIKNSIINQITFEIVGNIFENPQLHEQLGY